MVDRLPADTGQVMVDAKESQRKRKRKGTNDPNGNCKGKTKKVTAKSNNNSNKSNNSSKYTVVNVVHGEPIEHTATPGKT